MLISSSAQHVLHWSCRGPLIRELDVSRLLDVSGSCPSPERYILTQRSDSVPQRTLPTALGIPGTVQGCLDACKNGGYRLGGVEYGG